VHWFAAAGGEMFSHRGAVGLADLRPGVIFAAPCALVAGAYELLLRVAPARGGSLVTIAHS